MRGGMPWFHTKAKQGAAASRSSAGARRQRMVEARWRAVQRKEGCKRFERQVCGWGGKRFLGCMNRHSSSGSGGGGSQAAHDATSFFNHFLLCHMSLFFLMYVTCVASAPLTLHHQNRKSVIISSKRNHTLFLKFFFSSFLRCPGCACCRVAIAGAQFLLLLHGRFGRSG
jgi:hypothetical protein